MKTFEVEYETTLPPWHLGYEKIEAEDTIAFEKKFKRKHEAARIRRYREVIYLQSEDSSF